jgi:GNAT superfamily N-acetyltransferase
MSAFSFQDASAAYSMQPLAAGFSDYETLRQLQVFLMQMPNALPRTRLLPELIAQAQASAVIVWNQNRIVGHAALLPHDAADPDKKVEEVSAVMVAEAHEGRGLAGQMRGVLHHMGDGSPQVMFARLAQPMRQKVINRLAKEGWSELPESDPKFQHVESGKPKMINAAPKAGFVRAAPGTVLAISSAYAACEHVDALAASTRPAIAG